MFVGLRVAACTVLGMALLTAKTYAVPDETTKIRVGLMAYVGDATVLHAHEAGYFLDEGLEVHFKFNGAGLESFRQVLKGDLDIATVSPTPLVYAAVDEQNLSADFRIIASVLDTSNVTHLVILDGQSIANPSQLVGKRLGVTLGTAAEYYWNNLAQAYGISPESAEIVDLPVTEMVDAARRGQVDAVVAWSPFHLRVGDAVDTPAATYTGTNYYASSGLLVAKPAFIEENSDKVAAYVRALLRAEQDILSDPVSVAESHARYFETTAEELADRYRYVDFNLNLSESLIVNLSHQFTWAETKGYVSGPAPNFARYLHRETLEVLRPDAVQLLD